MKDIGPLGLESDDIRIFMGEARLVRNQKPNGGFDFYFSDITLIQGEEHGGSYKIWANSLQPLPGSPLGPGITRMARRLDDALGTSNSAKVKLYILGKFKERIQKIEGDQQHQPREQRWLNFRVDNLDHVHFEII